MSLCDIIPPRGIDYTRERQTAATARRLDTSYAADWATTRTQWIVPFAGSDPARVGRLALGETPEQVDVTGEPLGPEIEETPDERRRREDDERTGRRPTTTTRPPRPPPPPREPTTTTRGTPAGRGAINYTATYIASLQVGSVGITAQNRLVSTPVIPWPFEIINIELRDNASPVNATWNLFLTSTAWDGESNVPDGPALLQLNNALVGTSADPASDTIGQLIVATSATAGPRGQPIVTVPNGEGKRIGLHINASGNLAANQRITCLITVRSLRPLTAAEITTTTTRVTSRTEPSPRPGTNVRTARDEQTARIRQTPPPRPPPPPPPDPCASATVRLGPGETWSHSGQVWHNLDTKSHCYRFDLVISGHLIRRQLVQLA